LSRTEPCKWHAEFSETETEMRVAQGSQQAYAVTAASGTGDTGDAPIRRAAQTYRTSLAAYRPANAAPGIDLRCLPDIAAPVPQGHQRDQLVAVPLDSNADRILHLAKSAGIYRGHPAPDQLKPAQNRMLRQEIALRLTKEIDWREALGPDANNPTATYYDGLTLRNATELNIRDAALAIESRIRTVLARRCNPVLLRMAPTLRDALIKDPTLSMEQPSADIRYGSREWVDLWERMRLAMQRGLDPVTMSVPDLPALDESDKADDRTNNGDAKVNGRPGPKQLSGRGLAYMANAAGKLTLTPDTSPAQIGEQLARFARETLGHDKPGRWHRGRQLVDVRQLLLEQFGSWPR
jgi:hypothetical protein